MNKDEWKKPYRKIAEDQIWNYENINDDILKEILMKMYYNDYKGLIAQKESVIEELKGRKLIKTIIYGDYTPHGVCYCVQGSPPKGIIYIPHIDYEKGYFYDGSMHNLFTSRNLAILNCFLVDAKKVISNWHKDNPLLKN